jgi:hypothetical protein
VTQLVGFVGCCGGFIVPLLSIWAVVSLFSLAAGRKCWVTEACYFGTLLIVAGCTLRTVACSHDCWLLHTACLGCMVVAGTLRRPASEEEPSFG